MLNLDMDEKSEKPLISLQSCIQEQPAQDEAIGFPHAIPLNQPFINIQPQPYVPNPSTYKFLAWFSCLCCFWPLGIPAVYYSRKTKTAISERRFRDATLASESARTFATKSIITGTILTLIFILVKYLFGGKLI
ncbi:synapse differentiation-inducing gene protein 1-like [Hydra vulgaris]|uniref:Synapse differentiation-inducing gene protein 1-like n=1 Tax=Hydra vulgaris TaxID=6087 RepID=A0ABM4CSQ4_HYDVU